MNLALLWRNDFIDASKHWVGRGPGNQTALGDDLVKVENAVPIAKLDSVDGAWPTESARQRGYSFKGYHLDTAGRPEFRYDFDNVKVTDSFAPIVDKDEPVGVTRSLSVEISNVVDGLVMRVASGGVEDKGDGWFQVNSSYAVSCLVLNPRCWKPSLEKKFVPFYRIRGLIRSSKKFVGSKRGFLAAQV